MNLKEQISVMIKNLDDALIDATKADDGVKAAATRVRKVMQEVRKQAQEIRKSALTAGPQA